MQTRTKLIILILLFLFMPLGWLLINNDDVGANTKIVAASSKPTITFTEVKNNSINEPGLKFLMSVTDDTALYDAFYNWKSTNEQFLRFAYNGDNRSLSFAENPAYYYHGWMDVPIFHGWHNLTVYATNMNSETTIVSMNIYVNAFIVNQAPVITTDLIDEDSTKSFTPTSNFEVLVTDDYGWTHCKMVKWGNEPFELMSMRISGLGSVGSAQGFFYEIPKVTGVFNWSFFVNDTLGSAHILTYELNVSDGTIISPPPSANSTVLDYAPVNSDTLVVPLPKSRTSTTITVTDPTITNTSNKTDNNIPNLTSDAGIILSIIAVAIIVKRRRNTV